MIEKAVKLLGQSDLVGIVTLPATEFKAEDRPAVILMNEGILHRVGAGRLHVKVARQMASRGFLCMRFDHASIGDSGPRRGHQKFEESAVEEVAAVMDYLEKTYGCKTFIMYGLCSGADVGFEMAVQDDRVVSLIQLDAWIYPSLRSKFNQFVDHYLPRIPDPRVWMRLVKRVFARKEQSDKRDEWYADPEYIRETPPKSHVEEGLRVLVGRGVHTLVCFSGGSYYGDYNYTRQYEDAFSNIDFKDTLQVEWFESSTHLFTALEDQKRLLNCIMDWVNQSGNIGVGSDLHQTNIEQGEVNGVTVSP